MLGGICRGRPTPSRARARSRRSFKPHRGSRRLSPGLSTCPNSSSPSSSSSTIRLPLRHNKSCSMRRCPCPPCLTCHNSTLTGTVRYHIGSCLEDRALQLGPRLRQKPCHDISMACHIISRNRLRMASSPLLRACSADVMCLHHASRPVIIYVWSWKELMLCWCADTASCVRQWRRHTR